MKPNVYLPSRQDVDLALEQIRIETERREIQSYHFYPAKPAVSRKHLYIALGCLALALWGICYILIPLAQKVENL